MSEEAISLVTIALQARLQGALSAAKFKGNVFVGPFDDPLAQAAALSLFPYRIVPNASLRNTDHRVPAAGSPPYAIHRNALPLDVYFLVSVGSGDSQSHSEVPLLRVLGFAIAALQRDPILPAITVTDSSIAVALGPDPVRVTFEPLSTDEIGRLWALFPTANYRTSVAYVVSPVWIDPASDDTPAHPVIEDSLRAGSRAAAG